MKKKYLASLLLILSLLLTACGGGNDSAKTTTGENAGGGKTLTIALQEEPENLDPLKITSIYSENVIRQIYDTLLVITPDGELENRLADSVDVSDDGLTYTIHLKDGITFSDGTEVTSDDVQFTLERAAESDGVSYIFEKIDPTSYERPDSATLIFKLKEADGSFLSALSHPYISIISKTAYESNPDGFSDHPIGSGPFVLDNWSKQDSVTLSRNPNYWGEEPTFDTMVFRIIPEASSRLIELESGGVDIALEISPNDVARVEENADLKMLRRMDNSVHFMQMDVTHPPFDKKEAREAMNYAIDTSQIIDSVYMGLGQVATSVINPNFKYSLADEMKPMTRDVAKAKELFAQAGVKEGDTIELYTSQDQVRKDTATIVQSQLAECGINVEITSLEWGAFVDAMKKHEHNMFIMSYTPSIRDPYYTLFARFNSKNEGVPPNMGYYASPELDALMAEGLKESDDGKRAEIYKQIQEFIHNDYPEVTLMYGEQAIGTRKNIQNFEVDPVGSHEFYRVIFESK